MSFTTLLFIVFEDWNEESVPHIIIIIINIFIQQNSTNTVTNIDTNEVEKADSTFFICGSPALLQCTN